MTAQLKATAHSILVSADDRGVFREGNANFKRDIAFPVVNETYFVDDKGQKQGPAYVYSFTLNRASNLKKNQKLIKKSTRGDLCVVSYKSKLETYKDGLLDGPVTEYRPDGSVLRVTPYRAGKADGMSVEYDLDGRAKTFTYYKDGKEVQKDPIKALEKVAELKFQKEVDQPARGTALRKVLTWRAREAQTQALAEYYDSPAPTGVVRRPTSKRVKALLEKKQRGKGM